MEYFIYQTWTTKPHSARIHRGSCPFCKDGMGRGATDSKNGKWHRSFASYAEAKSFADAIESVTVTDCKLCQPSN
jgi:hypothetical protein